MTPSCRLDTVLRLLRRTPREAQARRDAALVARIERARWRDDASFDCVEVDTWARNGAARCARRRYLAGLGYSV